MPTNINIPEIEKEEEIKEKLREEWNKISAPVETGQHPFKDMNDIADWWLSKLDTYADAKIDLIFAQEANRGGGMIKVRGRNGVTLMTKEQLAELDKNK